MSSYSIQTGEGGDLGTVQGTLGQARQAAQCEANDRGEAVFITGPGIAVNPDDDADIGQRVEPESAK